VSLTAWKSLIVVALSQHSGFGIDRERSERLECVIAEARSTCRQPKAARGTLLAGDAASLNIGSRHCTLYRREYQDIWLQML
jgi:hypothetical protein